MSIVTVTVLHYPKGARFRAFGNMGRFLMQPFQAPGLQFQKLLGSGRNFGVIPDFSQYVFLGVWECMEQARAFGQSAEAGRLFHGTSAAGTLYLRPFRSHGNWDGQNPFTSDPLPDNYKEGPVAVLTRATIRWQALPDFWRHVPQARQMLRHHQDQLLFALGVGEKPLVQQCTISVWRDGAAINQYAYRQSGHKEVVQRTRQRRWYSEELFARFAVIDVEGPVFHEIGMELAQERGAGGVGQSA